MPAALTAEALADLQIPDTVHISPDGKQVIYTTSPVGKKSDHPVSSIWIASTEQQHSARQLTSGQTNDKAPKWRPDGKSIAFLSDRSKAGESHVIYSLSMSGGEAIPLTKAHNKKSISQFDWSPDGAFIAFLSPDETTERDEAREKSKDDVNVWGAEWDFNRLRLLHFATGQVSTLVRRDAHVAQFTWSPDSRSLVYALHETPEYDSGGYRGVEFETCCIGGEKQTPLIKFPGLVAQGMMWRDDQVFFMAGYTPESCCSSHAIYKLSVEHKTFSLYDHGKKDDAAGIKLGNNVPCVKVQSGLYDKIKLLDRAMVIYEAPHALNTWDVYLRQDGQYLIVIGKGMVGHPAEIYSIEFNPENKCRGDHIELSIHGQLLRSSEMGIVKHLYCKSSDSEVDLDGIVVSPTPSRPMPTVVSLHGGPTSRYTESYGLDYFYWGPWLLQHQYAILIPNYRGGTSHGDSFTAYARGGMGTKEYEDILTLVEEGIKQGFVDKDRIIVSGWSQGGFLSYLAAVRNDPERGWNFKGAICGAGVTDWDLMIMASDASHYEAQLAGGAPWLEGKTKDDTATRSGSAIYEMPAANVPPILILHGEKDERVPLANAAGFQRACRHYNFPCEMAVYPREGHIIAERAHIVDMLNRVLRFVDKHIHMQPY